MVILNCGLFHIWTPGSHTEDPTGVRHQFILDTTMPVKNANRTAPARKHYKNTSFETLAASWFTYDDWEVFVPMIDHDMKTDLVVSDGRNFYRIQIKTIESNDESHVVENKWGDAKIDYVIYFSRTANWGYISKPFKQKRKKLNSPGNIRFHQHHKPFIKAFDMI
jgi:hypothetical protein